MRLNSPAEDEGVAFPSRAGMKHWSVFAAAITVVGMISGGSGGAAQGNAAKSADSARLNNIGVAYMNQQSIEKALGRFEEARQADPGSVVAMVNQGIAYLYLHRTADAEKVLNAALKLDPNSVRGWYVLGVTEFGAGNSAAALPAFRHAAALDPRDSDTHYFIGTIESGEKNYAEAVKEFETAISLNPLNASAEFGLARVLQRDGKQEEARKHIARFREITDSKAGALIGSSYGDQGRYAIAQNVLAKPEAAGAMIPVKFVPAGHEGSVSGAPVQTGGICVLDLQGDRSRDIVVMVPGEGLRAYQVGAEGMFEALSVAQTGLRVQGDGVACAVGDYDNDGRPDLAVALTDRVVLFHNLGQGRFADVTESVGIRALNRPAGLTFVDFDHDGDLDLLVTGAALKADSNANVLWRNNGNSTFTEWTKQTGFDGNGATRGAVLSDINNDRAVDLVVAEAEGTPQIFENRREGPFERTPLYAAADLPAARGLAISDFDKDGWMDVAVTHAGAPGLTVWRNREGKGFDRVPVSLPGVKGAWGVAPIDVDNDGWIDLAVVVEGEHGTELRVLRNLGPSGFMDVSEAVGVRGLTFKGARSVVGADMDGDGAADLVITDQDGKPKVLRNIGGNRNHSLRIALTGLADNKSAIGTKVEVFSAGNWQKFEVPGASGYMSQGSTEIIAGLGASERADIVRLLWPTGVPQDELDIAANKKFALTELDRRGSSCPVLFAWNGSKYEFITDMVGAAVVGHWVSPTARNQSDSDEWVKVDGDKLRSRNGNLSVRFGEPMEEVNYIDQLRLVAVDHPADTEVDPDERFLSERPFASGKTVVASRQARPLVGAWDDRGRDVLALLSSRDRKYVQDFTNLSYAGFANMHTLTLDVGDWTAKNPLRLFAHGYVEYFSASSMYAAWQAGVSPHPPSIDAQLTDGSWKTVVEDAGFPAGLPRTIVIDLTGKLPEGTRRIRLTTNLQIYWDEMRIDNGPEVRGGSRQTELPLSSAHLEFRGYPKQIELESPGDLTYDYQAISTTGPFTWQRGSYTRYGDVTPLLQDRDDHYVIFGTGEDIDAEFRDATLPALPAGWKRDYFFYADGFVKDMDFYEAMPFTVSEMPFHGMSTYPYSSRQHYPADPESVRYQLDWNDRMESGDRTQRFRFDYKRTESKPMGSEGSAQ